MRTSAKEFLDCADDELFAFSNNELNNRPREGPAMTTTATTCGCGAATPRPTANPARVLPARGRPRPPRSRCRLSERPAVDKLHPRTAGTPVARTVPARADARARLVSGSLGSPVPGRDA